MTRLMLGLLVVAGMAPGLSSLTGRAAVAVSGSTTVRTASVQWDAGLTVRQPTPKLAPAPSDCAGATEPSTVTNQNVVQTVVGLGY